MENQAHSSQKPLKKGWFISLIDVVLSYYSYLISQPFRSGLVYFLAGLIPSLALGWLIFPALLYSKQPQPLQFNHAIHTHPQIGIEGKTEEERCLQCHGFREDGTFTGIPNLATCMKCHDDPESTLGETPEEEKFNEEYVALGKEVPWLLYHRQPDCVYFSHIAHVKMGKQECRTCHGDHGRSEKLPLHQRNRISTYSRNIWGYNIAGYVRNPWERMKMDNCADCHTKTGHEENNACFVCHK
ncbi:MAG: cytochrome C [Deltaproteobacteria bacterium]|nr:cytochrome C [Deltaproteobacteria bacterium]